MDLFVVPTIGFDLLYVLVIIRLGRRDLVWINVTIHPTAEWIARQITEGNLEQYPLSVISGLAERTVVSTRAKVDPRSGPF